MSKRRQAALKICIWLLASCSVMVAAVGAAEPSSIYMQELTAAKASKKVATVLWTRRSDRYTLQVVFPKESGISFFIPANSPPTVRLWLLSADGSVIPAARVPPENGNAKASSLAEITYSVSRAAGQQVVAAVLKIDDEYFIDAISPLNEK